jgi:hypothetical protein
VKQNEEQRPVELPLLKRERNSASSGNGKRPRGPIPATRPDLDDRGAALIQVELGTWADIASETRIDQLQTLDDRYHGILDELYGCANLCVDRYQEFSKSHARWRRTLIIGTGAIALVNLGAINQTKWFAEHSNGLQIAAAVCAIVLAILANLESFSNSLEKAQAYRESRELFLDVAREFDRRWDIYVRPYAETPAACSNAAELYRQIVIRDRELRAKFKEMTKTESRAPRRTQ